MSGDSDETAAAAWDAQIPIRLTLAAADLVADENPAPILVMVRRYGYLAFAADQARPLFQHLLPPGEDSPWLEFNGRPLQWHIPAGVLHDLLCPKADKPWSLTVHYRACPVDEVLPWTSDLWRSSFINSLKEAAVIYSGSASRLLQMTSSTRSQLYKSAEAGDMAALSHINSQLGLPVVTSAQRLPLRVTVLTQGGSIQTASYPMPQTGSKSPTLREVLTDVLGTESELAGKVSDSSVHEGATKRVKIAGICPPLDLKVAWLHAMLHAADHFLYIAVDL